MENDLISRSALDVKLRELSDAYDRGFEIDKSDGVQAAMLCLRKAPTVDAVEVVRCKDCKYCFFDLSGRAYHLCMRHGVTARYRVQSEDFCSYGKWRTDDGK